jgi:hypothetical protein
MRVAAGTAPGMPAHAARPGVDRSIELWRRAHKRLYCHPKSWFWRWRLGRPADVDGRGARRVGVEELGLTADALDDVRRRVEAGEVVTLARMTQVGLFLSEVGPLANLPTIDGPTFPPRKRAEVNLVATRDCVAVRKHFKGDLDAFVRELSALYYLERAGCRTPALLAVDFRARTLTCSFVMGPVLGQQLLWRVPEAAIRVVPGEAGGITRARLQQRRPYLHEFIDADGVRELAAELERVHAAGVVMNDIKYGNVVIDAVTGKPCLIDFDRADVFRWRKNPVCAYLCARDWQSFAEHFDLNYPV